MYILRLLKPLYEPLSPGLLQLMLADAIYINAVQNLDGCCLVTHNENQAMTFNELEQGIIWIKEQEAKGVKIAGLFGVVKQNQKFSGFDRWVRMLKESLQDYIISIPLKMRTCNVLIDMDKAKDYYSIHPSLNFEYSEMYFVTFHFPAIQNQQELLYTWDELQRDIEAVKKLNKS